MEKYHPVHSKKREDLALAGVKKRLAVRQQLESEIPVCVEESSKLEAFLDQVVAKLEHREEDKDSEDGLHKTSSIFLKTLPANITREELEEICKKFPGFLRVCLSDPVAAKKWKTAEVQQVVPHTLPPSCGTPLNLNSSRGPSAFATARG